MMKLHMMKVDNMNWTQGLFQKTLNLKTLHYFSLMKPLGFKDTYKVFTVEKWLW